MPNARAFDPAEYRDNPKMIAKYLNNALASGDVALITKAIGDMVWAQGPSRFSRKVGFKAQRPEIGRSPGIHRAVLAVGTAISLGIRGIASRSYRSTFDRLGGVFGEIRSRRRGSWQISWTPCGCH
jgi:DNA-binding phage protein